MTGILKRPIVTEKITALQDKRQYAFEVTDSANKIEIVRAIEKKFKVTVMAVRTVVVKGKRKTQMTRRGRFEGRTATWKKAIVRIPGNQRIELFEGV